MELERLEPVAAEPLDGAVVERDVADLGVIARRDGEAVVLSGDEDALRARDADGVVGAAVAERELEGLQPEREADEPVRWITDFGEAALTHVNLYDRTVEGLVLRDVPASTVQYHPEAGPGPHDAVHLFDRFVQSLAA